MRITSWHRDKRREHVFMIISQKEKMFLLRKDERHCEKYRSGIREERFILQPNIYWRYRLTHDINHNAWRPGYNYSYSRIVRNAYTKNWRRSDLSCLLSDSSGKRGIFYLAIFLMNEDWNVKKKNDGRRAMHFPVFSRHCNHGSVMVELLTGM